MRTARTIGIKSDGSEVLLCDSRTPADVQLAAFRAYPAKGFPDGVVRIDYCTSDGRTRSMSAAALAAVSAAIKQVEEKQVAVNSEMELPRRRQRRQEI